MYGSYPRGMLAVFVGSRAGAGADDFSRRFEAGLRRAIDSGAASRGFHFRRAAGAISPAGQLDPGYLAIFESDQPDPEPLAAVVGDSWSDDTDAGRGGSSRGTEPLLSILYEWVGPEFRAGLRGRVAGILVVLTDRLPAVPPEAFEEWYNNIHIPEILETGLYHTAYRYRTVGDAGSKPEYAALYETDRDPALAANKTLDLRGTWSGHPRYGSVSEVRLRWAFEPWVSPVSPSTG